MSQGLEQKLEQARDLHQKGQVQEAARLYREILEADPKQVEALHLMGLAALQLKQPGPAARLLRQALDARPEVAAYWGHFGIALTQLDKLDAAIAAYRKAIEIDPGHSDALSNLGNTLQRQGRLEEAIAAYRQALKVGSQNAPAAYNLGIALKARGELSEAAQAYRTAIAIKPDYDRAHSNLGNVLEELGDLDAALDCYRRALEINPRLVKGIANLASLKLETGAVEEAIADYERALALEPDDADTRYNYAQALLLLGHYSEGWQAQECRFSSTQLADQARHFTAPEWQGEALAGRSLFVWGEQGAGDQIQFASLFAELADKAGPVLIDCDERLLPVFRRSFPDLTFEPQAELLAERSQRSGFDCHISMGSLCRLLRATEADFPDHGGYLQPESAKRAAFVERLTAEAQGRRLIGLSWASSGGRTGRGRSAALQQWAPILQQPGCCFVDLQYGAVQEEVAGVSKALGIQIVSLPDVDPLRDLDTFLALVAALDLVITVGNTTAHVAGALGRPAWVLLPVVPSWRWMLGREDSPWYPSLRLFRQETQGDWDPVIAQLAAGLPSVKASASQSGP